MELRKMMMYISSPEIVEAVQWDGTEEGSYLIANLIYGLECISNLGYSQGRFNEPEKIDDPNSPPKLFYILRNGETIYGQYFMLKGDWMVVDYNKKSAISINEKAFAEKFKKLDDHLNNEAGAIVVIEKV